MTRTEAIEIPHLAGRWPGFVLAGLGGLLVLASLYLGLLGFSISERFNLDDARPIEGGMYLFQLNDAVWPEPPFRLIDDARHGKTGTASRFLIDGTEVTASRVSTTILKANEAPGFLHTGLRNFYFAPGPDLSDTPTFEAIYSIRIDSAIWSAGIVAGLLVMAVGLCLAMGLSGLAVALTGGLALLGLIAAWLSVIGIDRTHPLDPASAYKYPPNGFYERLERPWPLYLPATDRQNAVIRGQLIWQGTATGDATALGGPIRNDGDGAHLMGTNGLFYYSLPGNPGPDAAQGGAEVRVTALLPISALVVIAAGFGLAFVFCLATGAPAIVAPLLRLRPGLGSAAIPGAIVVTVGGYVGWLMWVDALHFRNPPEERDWFAAEEGWRMAGLVRTWPYEAILLGTSVSQNVYMAEATEALGQPVLNASMAGSTPREQAALAQKALDRDSTKRIIWEVHLNNFGQPPETMRYAFFPLYLYDGDPLNDMEYWFSLQAWLDATDKRLAHALDRTKRLDPINKWGERLDFGGPVLARTYCDRRDRTPSPLDLENLRATLNTHVLSLARSHPEVRFTLYIPAYSILMHMDPGGRYADLEKVARVILDETRNLPNVELFDFQGLGPEIADITLFRDDIHAHPEVTRRAFRQMGAGEMRMTAETLDAHEARLSELFDQTSMAFASAMTPFCKG